MNTKDDSNESQQSIQDEILDLEKRLADAKKRLKCNESSSGALVNPSAITETSFTNSHFLLLLSDSALPLGSFAFSSGLESYISHTKQSNKPPSFPLFLTFSLSSYASTTLPFVLAAYREPEGLLELDDLQDAAVMCTVGRRASVAQGRALMGIWRKSFSASLPSSLDSVLGSAVGLLKEMAVLLRQTSSSTTTMDALPPASAHLAPLFGVICRILGISIEQTAYVFMLSHVKALLSAAVRASMFGPYQAQKVLAGSEVQEGIKSAVEKNWDVDVEDAGQSVPVMDLWIGRHEILYSRIFNS